MSFWCLEVIFTILSTGSKCRGLYWKVLTSEAVPCEEYPTVINNFAMWFGKGKQTSKVYNSKEARKEKERRWRKPFGLIRLKKACNSLSSATSETTYLLLWSTAECKISDLKKTQITQVLPFFLMTNLTINIPHYCLSWLLEVKVGC